MLSSFRNNNENVDSIRGSEIWQYWNVIPCVFPTFWNSLFLHAWTHFLLLFRFFLCCGYIEKYIKMSCIHAFDREVTIIKRGRGEMECWKMAGNVKYYVCKFAFVFTSYNFICQQAVEPPLSIFAYDVEVSHHFIGKESEI